MRTTVVLPPPPSLPPPPPPPPPPLPHPSPPSPPSFADLVHAMSILTNLNHAAFGCGVVWCGAVWCGVVRCGGDCALAGRCDAGVAQAEVFGAASAKTMRSRAIALTDRGERLASAGVSASEEATLSTSRVREALQTSRAAIAKRSHRLTEDGAQMEVYPTLRPRARWAFQPLRSSPFQSSDMAPRSPPPQFCQIIRHSTQRGCYRRAGPGARTRRLPAGECR